MTLVILTLFLDRSYHEKYLAWHLLLLTDYCFLLLVIVIAIFIALILIFQKKMHFEDSRRWYLQNQLGDIKKLRKLSVRTSVANYVWVYLCYIFVLYCRYTFVKLRFSSSAIPSCLWWDSFSTRILFRVMVGWMWALFFLENSTSSASLLGSGLKRIFHVWAQQVIVEDIINFIWILTIVKREVTSAKSFTLGFNSVIW